MEKIGSDQNIGSMLLQKQNLSSHACAGWWWRVRETHDKLTCIHSDTCQLFHAWHNHNVQGIYFL